MGYRVIPVDLSNKAFDEFWVWLNNKLKSEGISGKVLNIKDKFYSPFVIEQAAIFFELSHAELTVTPNRDESIRMYLNTLVV